jgi:hypothetical protein
MHTQLNCMIKEQAVIHTEEFHVDEERQLISMTLEGLESVLNTAFQLAADMVESESDRVRILNLQIK